jgi:hypothetical protein
VHSVNPKRAFEKRREKKLPPRFNSNTTTGSLIEDPAGIQPRCPLFLVLHQVLWLFYDTRHLKECKPYGDTKSSIREEITEETSS